MAGPEEETKFLPRQESDSVKIARLEEQVSGLKQTSAATLKTVTEIHSDLKQHMKEERADHDSQGQRIGKLEVEHEETKTHFKWLKGAFATVQAAVIAWVSTK